MKENNFTLHLLELCKFIFILYIFIRKMLEYGFYQTKEEINTILPYLL